MKRSIIIILIIFVLIGSIDSLKFHKSYLRNEKLNNVSHLADCNTGTYKDTNTGNCQNCNSACASCNGPSDSNCLKCAYNYYLFDKKCVSTCPTESYSDPSDN